MASYTPNYNLYKPAGTDQFDNFLTEFGNNMDVIDQNLGGGGGSSTLGGLSDVNLTSPITNDALIYDGAEWVNTPLSAVAFSGDYSDLLNAPTIPTKTSDLNNDSDFVSDSAYVHTDNNFTNADVTKLSGIQAGAEVNVQSDWNEADNTADDYIKNKPTIPTNTSDLNNDSGFLDSSDITVTQVQTTGTKIATVDVDGNSTDLYAPTGGGSKHTILNESGTALADEPNLQFADGLKASDDSGNSKTKVGVDTTFTEASVRTNILSGDSLSTILGKIRKWFTDIPDMFLKLTGGTLTGTLFTNATYELQISVTRNHTNTTSQPTTVLIGNNTPDGTAGSTYGVLRLLGKGAYATDITAPDASVYGRSIKFPDASGTVALTSDLSGKTNNVGNAIFNCSSNASSIGNKYCLVANIEISGGYADGVVEVTFSLRSYPEVKKVWFRFANVSGADPSVDYFRCSDDTISAYLVRTASGKWGLYIAYHPSEGVAHYSVLSLHSIIYNDEFALRATITPNGTAVTSLPSGTSVKAESYEPVYKNEIRTASFDATSASTTYEAIYMLHQSLKDGQKCACIMGFSTIDLFVTGYRKEASRARYLALDRLSDTVYAYRVYNNTVYQTVLSGTVTSATIN